MTDKAVVRTIESRACIEKIDGGWLVRKHPGGRVLGCGAKPAQAWHQARRGLFGAVIGKIISEIPVSN